MVNSGSRDSVGVHLFNFRIVEFDGFGVVADLLHDRQDLSANATCGVIVGGLVADELAPCLRLSDSALEQQTSHDLDVQLPGNHVEVRHGRLHRGH